MLFHGTGAASSLWVCHLAMETARDSGVGRGAGEARGRSGLSNQHALALKGKPVGMNALGGQTLGFELIGISLIGNLLLGR